MRDAIYTFLVLIGFTSFVYLNGRDRIRCCEWLCSPISVKVGGIGVVPIVAREPQLQSAVAFRLCLSLINSLP